MKTETKERITNENARITAENVQHIGECIVLSAIKKMMRFAHHPQKRSIFPAIRRSASKNARPPMLPLTLRPSMRSKTTLRSMRSSIKCA